jgi:D-3-phosphoglycerate dehydrogenase
VPRKLVVVTDHAFEGLAHEQRAAAAEDAEFHAYSCTTEDQAIAAVSGADVVITNFAPITAGVLAAMRPDGVVVRYGIGYDNVDVAAAARLGNRVANGPD